MKLTIYRYKKGEVTKPIVDISDFSVIGTWMDIKQVTTKVTTPVEIEFKAYSENGYDYVEVSGNKYILFNEPTGRNKNEVSKYEYDLVFFGEEVLLKTALLRDVVTQGSQNLQEIRYNNGSLVEFYGGATEFAQRMKANTDNQLGVNTWKFIVDISTEIGLAEKYFVFDALNCWDALKAFSQDTGLDFYITTPISDGASNTVIITDKKQKVIPYVFEQGQGKGLFDISKSDSSNGDIVTRLYAQGGERNIQAGYKKNSLPVDDSRYSPFLLLPDNPDGTIRYYIDDVDAVRKFGIRPKVEKFDYIFPSIYDIRLKDLYPSKLVGNTFPSGTIGNDDVNIGGLSGDLRVDSIVGCDDIVENGQQFFNIYTTDLGFFLDKKSKFPDERVEIPMGEDALNQGSGFGSALYAVAGHMTLKSGKDITLPDFEVLTPKGRATVTVSLVPEGDSARIILDEYSYSDPTTDVRHTVKGKVVNLKVSDNYLIWVSVLGFPENVAYPPDATISIFLKGKNISYVTEGIEYYDYYTTSNAVISMRDGRYGGYDFTIQKDGTKKLTERSPFYDKGARYSIKLARLEDSGSYLPSLNAPMAPNERFVIIGIKMPDTYVAMAENRLLTASLEYMSKNNFAKAAVSMKISTGFVIDNSGLFSDFIAGNVCKVKDSGIGIEERELSINSVTVQYTKESLHPEWSCSLSDVKTYSRFEQLSKDISSVGKSQKSSDLLTSDSINTLYKEFSEAKANFVTIDTPQSVLEKKNFRKGLNIDGISITKHTDGYMEIDGDILVNGAVTFNGAGEMDAVTITDAVNVDEVTIKKVNGILTAVGGGGGGGLSKVTVKVGTTPYESVEGVVSLPAYPVVPSLTDYATLNTEQAFTANKWWGNNFKIDANECQPIIVSPATGGFDRGLQLQSSTGARMAKFGFMVANDTLSYAYIGDRYDYPWLKVNPDASIESSYRFAAPVLDCTGINGRTYIAHGNGDSPTFNSHNMIIRSWWGIGFHDNGDNCNLVIDCRSGNVYSKGYTTWGSDARYKTILENINIPLDKIADAPTIRYKWNKEGMSDETRAGGTAQYMEDVIPEVVKENDDFKSLDYATTAYIFAVQDARYIRELEKRVEAFEKQSETLSTRVEALERKMNKPSILKRLYEKITLFISAAFGGLWKGGRHGSI